MLMKGKKKPSRKELSRLADRAYNSILDAGIRNELNKRNELAYHIKRNEKK